MYSSLITKFYNIEVKLCIWERTSIYLFQLELTSKGNSFNMLFIKHPFRICFPNIEAISVANNISAIYQVHQCIPSTMLIQHIKLNTHRCVYFSQHTTRIWRISCSRHSIKTAATNIELNSESRCSLKRINTEHCTMTPIFFSWGAFNQSLRNCSKQ